MLTLIWILALALRHYVPDVDVDLDPGSGTQALCTGLALKNPPKKTHPKKPKKTHLKKPTKSGFFWFFGFF
jgi:hypothetical protein